MKYDYFLDKLPMLEIEIFFSNKSVRLLALIDTGADYTIFPRTIAQKLNIPLENGKIKILEGAGGTILARVHPVKINIGGIKIKTLACFSEKNDVPEQILGRLDILNHFKLVLDKHYFELIEHKLTLFQD